MPRIPLALATLCACFAPATAAIGVVPLPAPVDTATGETLVLSEARAYADGSILALDADGGAHFTANRGESWTTVRIPSGGSPSFFGLALRSGREDSVFRDGAWTAWVEPDGTADCDDSWAQAWNDGGFYSACLTSDGLVQFWKTSDTARTWVDWFSIEGDALEALGADPDGLLGVEAGGFAWWNLADGSGWIRSADGEVLDTVEGIPSVDSAEVASAFGDTLVAADDAWSGPVYYASVDGGATWDSVDDTLGVPYRLVPGVWAAALEQGDGTAQVRLGPSIAGPWDAVPGILGSLSRLPDGALLVVSDGALALLDTGVAGLSERTGNRVGTTASARVVRGRTGWLVEFSEASGAADWTLSTPEGRRVASGRLASGERTLAIPAASGVRILRVQGRSAILLPVLPR